LPLANRAPAGARQPATTPAPTAPPLRRGEFFAVCRAAKRGVIDAGDK
jgi:hypothetical protein